jgi:hypothetical protein
VGVPAAPADASDTTYGPDPGGVPGAGGTSDADPARGASDADHARGKPDDEHGGGAF